MKERRNYILLGIFINLYCAIFMVLFTVTYLHWMSLPSKMGRINYEEMTQVVCGQILPIVGIVSLSSTYVFLKIRKWQ